MSKMWLKSDPPRLSSNVCASDKFGLESNFQNINLARLVTQKRPQARCPWTSSVYKSSVYRGRVCQQCLLLSSIDKVKII